MQINHCVLNMLLDCHAACAASDPSTPPLVVSRDSLEAYSVVGALAYGCFGDVFVVSKGGRCYALKRISKAKARRQPSTALFMAERDCLAACRSSKRAVHLVAAFQDTRSLFFVMPFLGGGDLLSLLARVDVLGPDAVAFYFCEVLLALRELHSLGFVHRDIKPENILIARDGHIRLADFGSCARLPAVGTHPIGTPDYIAPEVLSGRMYGFHPDIWSAGVVLYEMAAGAPPFAANRLQETYRLISACEYKPLDNNQLQELVNGCLTDMDKRWSIDKLLNHTAKMFNLDLEYLAPPYTPSSDWTHNFCDIQANEESETTEVGFSGFIGFTYDPAVRIQTESVKDLDVNSERHVQDIEFIDSEGIISGATSNQDLKLFDQRCVIDTLKTTEAPETTTCLKERQGSFDLNAITSKNDQQNENSTNTESMYFQNSDQNRIQNADVLNNQHQKQLTDTSMEDVDKSALQVNIPTINPTNIFISNKTSVKPGKSYKKSQLENLEPHTLIDMENLCSLEKDTPRSTQNDHIGHACAEYRLVRSTISPPKIQIISMHSPDWACDSGINIKNIQEEASTSVTESAYISLKNIDHSDINQKDSMSLSSQNNFEVYKNNESLHRNHYTANQGNRIIGTERFFMDTSEIDEEVLERFENMDFKTGIKTSNSNSYSSMAHRSSKLEKNEMRFENQGSDKYDHVQVVLSNEIVTDNNASRSESFPQIQYALENSSLDMKIPLNNRKEHFNCPERKSNQMSFHSGKLSDLITHSKNSIGDIKSSEIHSEYLQPLLDQNFDSILEIGMSKNSEDVKALVNITTTSKICTLKNSYSPERLSNIIDASKKNSMINPNNTEEILNDDLSLGRDIFNVPTLYHENIAPTSKNLLVQITNAKNNTSTLDTSFKEAKKNLISLMDNPNYKLHLQEIFARIQMYIETITNQRELIQCLTDQIIRENNLLKREIRKRDSQVDISGMKFLDEIKKELKKSKSEVKEVQQKLDSEIFLKERLQDEIKYLTIKLKNATKTQQIREILTEVGIISFCENNKRKYTVKYTNIEITTKSLIIDNKNIQLSNVFIQNLKENELFYIPEKNRRLILKIIIITTRKTKKLTNTQSIKSEDEMNFELNREKKILLGLENLLKAVDKNSEIYKKGIEQKEGTLKRINQLKCDIDFKKSQSPTHLQNTSKIENHEKKSHSKKIYSRSYTSIELNAENEPLRSNLLNDLEQSCHITHKTRDFDDLDQSNCSKISTLDDLNRNLCQNEVPGAKNFKNIFAKNYSQSLLSQKDSPNNKSSGFIQFLSNDHFDYKKHSNPFEIPKKTLGIRRQYNESDEENAQNISSTLLFNTTNIIYGTETEQSSKTYEFNNHIFETKTFHSETICYHCDQILYGKINQGMQCQECAMIVHKTCYVLIEDSCEMYRATKEGSVIYILCRSIEEKSKILSAFNS